MRARYIKFAILVVALVVVWNLGQSYVVTNALFMFAAAGVVPGTDITLKPDQVLALLGGVLALAFVLIFGSNIRRGLRALFSRNQEAAAAEATAAAAVSSSTIGKKARGKRAKAAKPQPVLVIEPPRRPSKVLLLLHVAITTAGITLRTYFARAHRRWPAVTAAIVRGYRYLEVVAARLAAQLRRAFIRVAIAVCRAAIRVWRWLEPRLRRFDAWLGVRYHRFLAAAKRNETVKLAAGFAREAGKVVSDITASLRAVLDRVAQK